jgi:quercetin dioxygenase-like cupin family protein
MTHVKAIDAPTFTLPGVTFTGLAAPSRGCRETAVWRVRVEPGAPPAAHFVDREEVFVAIDGSAVARVGDDSFRVTPGDALVVAPNTLFDLTADGDVPFEAVVAFPVGGRACMTGGEPFVPPWAE